MTRRQKQAATALRAAALVCVFLAGWTFGAERFNDAALAVIGACGLGFLSHTTSFRWRR